jgi:hypothetical protein
LSEKTWRYTDASGALHEVDTTALREALKTASIPSSTLVWHEGMAEWAPAFTIPELSSAAIAGARTPSIPPTGNRPPSIPPTGDGIRRRPPMKTLVGVDAPELLRQSAEEKELARLLEARPKSIPPPLPPEARSRSTRPGPPRTPSIAAEGQEPVADVPTSIPRAPALPRDASTMRASSTSEAKTNDARSTLAQGTPLGGVTAATAAHPTLQSAGTALVGGTPRSVPPPLPEAKRPPPKRLPTPLPLNNKAPASMKRPGATPTLLGLPKAAATQQNARSKPPPPPLRGKTTLVMPVVQADESKLGQKKPAPPPLKDRTPRPQEVTEVLASPKPAEKDAEKPTDTPAAPIAAEKSLLASMKTEELEAVKEPTATSRGESNGAATPEEAKAIAALRKQNRTLELEAPESVKVDPRPPSVVEAERKLSEEHTEPITKTLLDAKTLLAQSKAEESSDTITVTVQSDRDVASIETTPRKIESKSKKKAKPDASDPEGASIAVARPLGLRGERAIEIPRRSLIAASVIWMLGLVGFFFVGRVTGFRAASVETAATGIRGAFAPAAPIATNPAIAAAEPKPCWVVRQPVKWANEASKSVAFDMHPSADGKMSVGFAASEKEALGIVVDPKSGKFEEKYREKIADPIARVSPWASAASGFVVSKKSEKVAVSVDVTPPFVLFFDKTSVGVADSLEGTPNALFDLTGDGATAAEQVIDAGPGGFFVTYRQGTSVFGAFVTKERTKGAGPSAVIGAGGKGGKPKSGFNGQEVAVAFAERPEGENKYQLRVGRAAAGSVPETTALIALPEGGPGGDAIAPDIVGLSEGRWLLMWTEGSEGERAIRAQTYSSAFDPIGDPIALSPPAGDFGQAVLGTVGSYTLVVFLQRGAEAFELWGAVLRCG